MMVLSLIFACDNWRICASAEDSCVVEVAIGAVGTGGVSVAVGGGGISSWPKAFVSCAKSFGAEIATSAAAANVMPVFWKPCIFIKSHSFCMIQHHNLALVARHVKA